MRLLLKLVSQYYSTGDSLHLRAAGIPIFNENQADEEPKPKRIMRPKQQFDFQEGKRLFFEYYLARKPVFRTTYRMELDCFLKMMGLIRSHCALFERGYDALSNGGIFPEIKLLACLRVLVTGLSMAQVADIYKIGRQTVDRMFSDFISVVPVALAEFTAFPSDEEAKKICQEHEEQHGFKGMLGSLDCLHWEWHQCMLIDKYAYCGKSGKPSIVLEAICKRNLKFLYFNFGAPGVQNDLAIIRSSPILRYVAQDKWPRVSYNVAGLERTQPYVLCDGIYPKWNLLVLAFAKPIGAEEEFFTQRQESCRKDIERAFGVMRKRFNALRSPCVKKNKDKIVQMMNTMLSIHNLIVEWNEESRSDDFLASEMDQQRAEYTRDTQAWRQARGDDVLSRELLNNNNNLEETGDGGGMGRLAEMFDATRHHNLREALVKDMAERFLKKKKQ